MKNKKMTSLILCGLLMMLVVSFAWAKVTVHESKTLKWGWAGRGDQGNGGNSTVNVTEGQQDKMPAWTIKGNLGTGWEYCAAYITATPDANTLEILKKASGIAFKVLGDGDRYKIKMVTSDVKDSGYFEYFFETVKGAAITVVVPTTFFLKPSWTQSGPGKLNINNVTDIEFETGRPGTPGAFELKIWDIRLFEGDSPTLSAAEKKANDKAIADAAAAEAKIAKPVGGNLGAQSVTMTDNFKYGGNWQGHFREPILFNGNKISKGETYTLKITFTANRDLTNSLWIGLVDPSPSAGDWKPLSWPSSKDLCVAGQEIKDVKGGVPVSVTLTFTTLQGSTGARPNQNSLVFASRDDSPKKGPITLNFTEFVFTKN
jgi:hypothetical protein